MENENKLPPDFKAKWVAALRSGEYKQGRGQLRNHNNEYCCLGVACIVTGYEVELIKDKCYVPKDFELIPMKLRGASYDSSLVKLLANMNDGQDPQSGRDVKISTFSEIADYIEENL